MDSTAGPSTKSLIDDMLTTTKSVLKDHSPARYTESVKESRTFFGSLGLKGEFNFAEWGEHLRLRVSQTLLRSDKDKLKLALAMIMVMEPVYLNCLGVKGGNLDKLLLSLEITLLPLLENGMTKSLTSNGRNDGKDPAAVLRRRLTKATTEAFDPSGILKFYNPKGGVKDPFLQYRAILSRHLHVSQPDYLDRAAHLPAVILAFAILVDPLKKKFYQKKGMRGILELEYFRVSDLLNRTHPGYLPIAWLQTREAVTDRVSHTETVRENTEDLMLEVQYLRIIRSIQTEAEITRAVDELYSNDGCTTLNEIRDAAIMMNAQYVEVMDQKNKEANRKPLPTHRKRVKPGVQGTAFGEKIKKKPE